MIKGIEALRLLQEGKELKSGEFFYTISEEQILLRRVGFEDKWQESCIPLNNFMQNEFELVPAKEYNYYEAAALAFKGWELRATSKGLAMKVCDGVLTSGLEEPFITTGHDLGRKWIKVRRKETTKGAKND